MVANSSQPTPATRRTMTSGPRISVTAVYSQLRPYVHGSALLTGLAGRATAPGGEHHVTAAAHGLGGRRVVSRARRTGEKS